MKIGFKFEILYRDNDLVKIRISARNSEFGGTADVYLATGHLGEIGAELQGFPRSTADTRELLFGAFGPDSAGGAVHMKFLCEDSSGRVCVETQIESDRDSGGMAQSASLLVRTEPAAIDAFVDGLRSLSDGATDCASLNAAV